MAGEAASILIAQLIGWLGADVVGYALLFWPFVSGGFAAALTLAGSSLFTLGFAAPPSGAPRVIVYLAAASGLIIVSLQIAYLPTLYGAFNRRETEVALLNARSGVPSWGPELLARTHYALGRACPPSTPCPICTPDGNAGRPTWRKVTAPIQPLVRFRSPRPLSSWVTALLAMLDSAALILALSPQSAPVVPARLFLRSGFLCFNQIANAVGIHVPDEPDPDSSDQLTYQEFLDGRRAHAKCRLPDRARPRRRLAGLRGLAPQLRASRLLAGPPTRRGASPLVRPPHDPRPSHPARPPQGGAVPEIASDTCGVPTA